MGMLWSVSFKNSTLRQICFYSRFISSISQEKTIKYQMCGMYQNNKSKEKIADIILKHITRRCDPLASCRTSFEKAFNELSILYLHLLIYQTQIRD